jgi:hypothetical protein
LPYAPNTAHAVMSNVKRINTTEVTGVLGACTAADGAANATPRTYRLRTSLTASSMLSKTPTIASFAIPMALFLQIKDLVHLSPLHLRGVSLST